jgi:hypothetical protein
LRGGVAKLKVEHDLARQRNFELAHLIAFSFHDPKKIPTFKSDSQTEEASDELAQAQVRGFFIAMASKAKG